MNIAKFRVDIWELSEDLWLNDKVTDQKRAEELCKVFDRIWKYKDHKWTEKNYKELRKLYDFGKRLLV